MNTTVHRGMTQIPAGIPKHNMLQKRYYLLTLFALLFGGIGVRVLYFSLDRPVWLDEAGLAINIVGKPWSALVGPMDASYSTKNGLRTVDECGFAARQTTPLGYLVALKTAAVLGHDRIHFLRLPSLIFSLIWLIAFAWSIRRKPSVENLLVFSVLVCSSSLIEYSTEIKQYGLEALVAATLQILFLNHIRKENSGRSGFVFLALAGAVSVWFSFSATFILMGNGAVLWVGALLRREKVAVWSLSLVGAVWIASFSLYYFSLLRDNFAMQAQAYQHAFPPQGLALINWSKDALLGLWQRPVGLEHKGQVFGAFMALIGTIVIWKRKPIEACLLISPIAVTFLMTILRQYPWSSFQLLLFLVFNLSVLFAVGVGELIRCISTVSRHAWVAPISIVALLLINSATQPIKSLREHDYFKTTAFLPLASAIQAEPEPQRLFLCLSDGIICRFYKSVSFEKWGEVGVSGVSFFQTPEDVIQFAKDCVVFADRRKFWVMASKVHWTAMSEALFVAKMGDHFVVTGKRESGGYVALELQPVGQ